MLINCPRCGFSQPHDQYCAQCGVDMQAFKPKAEPVFQKILKSTSTHIVLLVIVAVLVGQFMIRSEEPQRWVQKISRFQTINKIQSSELSQSTDTQDFQSQKESSISEISTENADQLNHLNNKEISVAGATEQPIQVAAVQTNLQSSDSSLETQGLTFRIIYAEVPTEVVTKWVNESSSAGLYQNMQDYSVGILPDYRKKIEASVRELKVVEKKLALTQSDTSFSGALTDEGTQMIGLTTSLDFKSNENNIIHGGLMIHRNQKLSRDQFPAEFDLPKASAFFVLGVLRRQNFQNERDILNMPPFQIFKSNDFMTQKTEFVIILEPEYK